MKKELEAAYKKILHSYGYSELPQSQNRNRIIRESLFEFVQHCEKPAIWCYGNHTKMLMADFIVEIKPVKVVIDAAYAGSEESGFQIIREDEIENNQIDGIIISSFRYREEIKQQIKIKYPHIQYLDVYEKLEEAGIVFSEEYYAWTHPYGRYMSINRLKRQLVQAVSVEEKAGVFRLLLGEYLSLKDFKTAIACLKEHQNIGDTVKNGEFLKDLEYLYDLELKAAATLSEHHVVMLCIDGLRRSDLLNGLMPNLADYATRKTMLFQNAYSVSTSTYESLIPAYSENYDLRTEYYKSNAVPEGKCRFTQEAIKQKRDIYFYTNSISFIEGEQIHVSDKQQTASEKFWDFILQALGEDNGLYYIHILYESHFSYSNPYTSDPLIADGSSILFDYLSRNGQKIRTDYDKQHRDAMRYLDDIVPPFLDVLNCRMVIYADHGNIILDQDAALEDIERTKLTFHEDLIQVPLMIQSPEVEAEINRDLHSIMEINSIIIGLMNRKTIDLKANHHIKAVRSELYNPDLKYLYRRCNYEHGLLAFEVFLFCAGYKLAVFSDGVREIYKTETDEKLDDRKLLEELWEQVKHEVTVTGLIEDNLCS